MTDSPLIIGASSGIGLALAEQLKQQGSQPILLSRKPENLDHFTCYKINGEDPSSIQNTLNQALTKHPDVQRIFIVSGTGDVEKDWNTDVALRTLQLNCDFFTRACYTSCEYLENRGFGQLIAVTSISGLRGGSASLSYNASKAYQSTLLEGISCRFKQSGKPIFLTEIRPGFVDTAMMKADKPFWVSSPQKAANQILHASTKKRNLAYVSRRWRIMAWLLKTLPPTLYRKIG